MIKMLDLERNTQYIAYNMEFCWILRKTGIVMVIIDGEKMQ